ncbi:polysaccharide biosynthesis/export family protein [Bacteroides faecium]|uniref:Polysaccharide export protein n=1 Tax=Bacteroides faecium TaxID=2715212 RepID=A0A6H0KST9_9BACE|nr:polysaccharide biosynthesis/export family protein [Bacteroides faecium]QIU95497.1 polysaccharide export protein [Bacteroides faecium]
MNMKSSCAFTLIFLSLLFSACQSYKKVPYLQDAEVLKQANTQVAPMQDAKLMPGDEISILVSTSDPVVSQPFNAQGNTFLLDNEGNINYPVLGKLSMSGLTSREAENLITERLKAYVKERPTVVVRMSGFKVSVLGEVASPGVYPVVNEQINVLEALAMAGDLTIYGVRDNVKLIREDQDGRKQFVTLNLNDADLLLSPYYRLQQNDILYVTPNKVKAQGAGIGQSTTLWISGFSVLVSIASLLVNILR